MGRGRWCSGRVLAVQEFEEGLPAPLESFDVFLTRPLRGPLDPAELQGDWVGGGCRDACRAGPDRGVQDGVGGRGVGEAVGVPPFGASLALEERGARSLVPRSLPAATTWVACVVCIEFWVVDLWEDL